jgi:hypothetical protein
MATEVVATEVVAT